MGGIYNFVTKRGDCRGRNSKISWTQVETGSAITWKYPSCILRGDNSRGEFYSPKRWQQGPGYRTSIWQTTYRFRPINSAYHSLTDQIFPVWRSACSHDGP